MTQPQMILYAVKLILGGIAAFLAVMLWSRTKDPAWLAAVGGTVASYAALVYAMLCELGVIIPWGENITGVPISTLIFTALPSLLFITAFAIMLFRKR